MPGLGIILTTAYRLSEKAVTQNKTKPCFSYFPLSSILGEDSKMKWHCGTPNTQQERRMEGEVLTGTTTAKQMGEGRRKLMESVASGRVCSLPS